LQIDPRQRPTIHTLVENIEDLAIGNDVGLNEPLLFLFNNNETFNSNNTNSTAAAAAVPGNPPSSTNKFFFSFPIYLFLL